MCGRPAGAPTVGKNEAHLRCMKNEAGLRPMKRGFAARRINEYASLHFRPVGVLHLKVKRSKSLSRAEFHLCEGKFRWVFGEDPKKGCLQTFEELSQKDTKVLPQAKCRETSRYFHSLSASSSKGFGETFSERRFPRVSRISRFSAQRQHSFGRIISSPTNP